MSNRHLIFPVAHPVYVTSRFNPARKHPVTGRTMPHNGTDYRAPTGTPLYAIMDGTVTSIAHMDPVGGNWVEVSHAGNVRAGYSHMSRIAVTRGQRVRKGDIIGYSGSTGSVTAAHLHFGVKINGAWVDPHAWLIRNNASTLGLETGMSSKEYKELSSKIDSVLREVRAGQDGKHPDGPAASLSRAARNEARAAKDLSAQTLALLQGLQPTGAQESGRDSVELYDSTKDLLEEVGAGKHTKTYREAGASYSFGSQFGVAFLVKQMKEALTILRDIRETLKKKEK